MVLCMFPFERPITMRSVLRWSRRQRPVAAVGCVLGVVAGLSGFTTMISLAIVAPVLLLPLPFLAFAGWWYAARRQRSASGATVCALMISLGQLPFYAANVQSAPRDALPAVWFCVFVVVLVGFSLAPLIVGMSKRFENDTLRRENLGTG
jgi:hypothetical protein